MLHVQSGTIGKLCTLKSLRMENDGDSTSVLVFLLATTKGGEHNKFSLTLKTFVWKWLTSDILFQNRWRNAIYSVFGGGEGLNLICLFAKSAFLTISLLAFMFLVDLYRIRSCPETLSSSDHHRFSSQAKIQFWLYFVCMFSKIFFCSFYSFVCSTG